jgi:hypothetical protein
LAYLLKQLTAEQRAQLWVPFDQLSTAYGSSGDGFAIGVDGSVWLMQALRTVELSWEHRQTLLAHCMSTAARQGVPMSGDITDHLPDVAQEAVTAALTSVIASLKSRIARLFENIPNLQRVAIVFDGVTPEAKLAVSRQRRRC